MYQNGYKRSQAKYVVGVNGTYCGTGMKFLSEVRFNCEIGEV